MSEESLEKLEHIRVPALDRILGQPVRVLDDGFIRVIDYMGTDRSIVQSARVSYGKGTRKTSRDRELIRYLMRHHHTSPFEMCEIKLHVRVPMDCWRQWIRHRTASVNEYSTRYSEAIDSSSTTHPAEWRAQSRSNKQGSEGFLDRDLGRDISGKEKELHRHARKIYQERLKLGVAREQARKDLPLSTYTEAYWKIDLHNLLHFLKLRLDPTAQYEIRTYAETIGKKIVKKWCPLSWEAFEDYCLNAVELSAHESKLIQALAGGETEEAIRLGLKHDLLKPGKKGGYQPTLEGREVEEKLTRFHLPVPWKK